MKHTYTGDDRVRIQGMIDAFLGAREYLTAGSGLCIAVVKWDSANFPRREQAREDALALICRALVGEQYLEHWERSSGFTNPRENPDAIAWREAWIEKIVSDCREALK